MIPAGLAAVMAPDQAPAHLIRAAVKCEECGAEIEDDADGCPEHPDAPLVNAVVWRPAIALGWRGPVTAATLTERHCHEVARHLFRVELDAEERGGRLSDLEERLLEACVEAQRTLDGERGTVHAIVAVAWNALTRGQP